MTITQYNIKCFSPTLVYSRRAQPHTGRNICMFSKDQKLTYMKMSKNSAMIPYADQFSRAVCAVHLCVRSHLGGILLAYILIITFLKYQSRGVISSLSPSESLNRVQDVHWTMAFLRKAVLKLKGPSFGCGFLYCFLAVQDADPHLDSWLKSDLLIVLFYILTNNYWALWSDYWLEMRFELEGRKSLLGFGLSPRHHPNLLETDWKYNR